MRARLRAAVEKCFERCLKSDLPGFERVDQVALPDECELYERRVTSKFLLYVMLQYHDNEDSFTIEIGWTLNGFFPEHLPMPRPPFEDAPTGDMLFRLGRLWEPTRDHWWHLAPVAYEVPLEEALKDYDRFLHDSFLNRPSVKELLPRVKPLVRDAVSKLLEYGMPYFQKIADKNAVPLGGSWKAK